MKALSAIIATIMLLMISVALVGVFYAFSSGMASSSTSSASEQASQITKQLTSCMKIDNIYNNQVLLSNCGKGVIENKSLVVMMDYIKLDASTTTIQESNSSVVNITGLWQIAPGKRTLKISNGAAIAQSLVDVQPNKDGLVGSWNFDVGSGNKANDDSGNGNIGTLLPLGSEPTWVNGKFGKGLQFDGSNDYVDAGNAASLDFSSTTPFTMSAWVYNNLAIPTSIDFRQIAAKYPGINAGYGFSYGYYLSGNYPGYLVWAGFYAGREGFTNYQVQSGQWTHITSVYNGTNWMIFINGVSQTTTQLGSGSTATASPFIIGRFGNSADRYHNGSIDEVRIYSKALTPDETVIMKQII